MNIQTIKSQSVLLLECISGSKAYGLATAQSDTDLKGVFALSKRGYYGLETTEQVSNSTNDEVYYELKRFVDLLLKNNPNILELLNTPPDCILFKHPLLNLLKPELFLSKLCQETFAGYAKAQIKKAKGLNKKIVNPMEKQRKSILDFCYVIQQQGSISLQSWLTQQQFSQEHCGLVNIAHMKEIYALFHNSQLLEESLRGIASSLEANDILLSSVPKDIHPLAIMSFNQDGYSRYCKDYKDYWDWVENRNEARYANTLEHGKNYDAKNMMHTFRLLAMAEEIAKEGALNVRRADREFLLSIRAGNYDYDELVQLAHQKISLIDELFKKSSLPNLPDFTQAEEVLIEIRDALYQNK
jgi:predicted nucleotidyltransferase